jgi:hypothetical protein
VNLRVTVFARMSPRESLGVDSDARARDSRLRGSGPWQGQSPGSGHPPDRDAHKHHVKHPQAILKLYFLSRHSLGATRRSHRFSRKFPWLHLLPRKTVYMHSPSTMPGEDSFFSHRQPEKEPSGFNFSISHPMLTTWLIANATNGAVSKLHCFEFHKIPPYGKPHAIMLATRQT